MKAAEMLDALDRIKGLIQEVSAEDGTIPGAENQITILLEVCEQVLKDAQMQRNQGDNESSD